MIKKSPRIPLRRQLTIAIIPGAVMLCVVVAAFATFGKLTESRIRARHTRDMILASRVLLQRATDAETGVRAFVVASDTTFLAPYRGARSDVGVQMRALMDLTAADSVQQGRVNRLDTVSRAQFSLLQRMIDSARAGKPLEAQAQFDEGKMLMDTVRSTIDQIVGAEEAQFATRDTSISRLAKLTSAIILIGGLFAVLVSLLANRTLASNLIRLSDANDELTTQAQRLEEQATELETQAAELEAGAAELEAANVELEEQAAELQEQRDQAQSARVTAEQANAAKSRFLSTMSHELRTPLNAVTGYVDLMDAGVHGPVTDMQREDIRRIKRAVSQLTSVINDILNFAKLEAGEVRFMMGPVEMHEALANAGALMEPQAEAKGIRFAYEPCDPTVTAYADRERVQQVVLNLLSNAVKYTEAGGEVHMQCVRNDGMIHVVVRDTGRGIANDDIPRIFHPFVQLLHHPHAPSDGVGLGLAIGRDLARGMGGDILVDSRLGAGSTFSFQLRAV